MHQYQTASSPDQAKQLSRGISHDMASEAIARRREIVNQMLELSLALRNSRRIEANTRTGSQSGEVKSGSRFPGSGADEP